MSPEQAQGQTVDARSDVFSFGAVLYEVLSGRRAFSGDTPLASLSAVVNDAPPPLDAPATSNESSAGVSRSNRATAFSRWPRSLRLSSRR